MPILPSLFMKCQIDTTTASPSAVAIAMPTGPPKMAVAAAMIPSVPDRR